MRILERTTFHNTTFATIKPITSRHTKWQKFYFNNRNSNVTNLILSKECLSHSLTDPYGHISDGISNLTSTLITQSWDSICCYLAAWSATPGDSFIEKEPRRTSDPDTVVTKTSQRRNIWSQNLVVSQQATRHSRFLKPKAGRARLFIEVFIYIIIF